MQNFLRFNSWKLASAAIALSTTLLTTGCQPQLDLNPNPAGAARSAASADFVEGEILVKMAKGAGVQGLANALTRVKGEVAEKILTKIMERMGDSEGVVLIKTKMNTLDAIEALRGAEGVEFAEPNFIYQHNAVSNDPGLSQLWGMGANGNQFGSQAITAWANGKTGSSTVYVGIIDEGYMYTHEDLAANAGTNPFEIAGNGRDDDANGYVDDVYGWDFAGNNSTVFDGTADDHGTHVAGTIGGVGGNGIGVAGVNWNVKLLSGKFLGSRGGTTANAIKAIDYFTELKKKGLNIVATNNSWGGGGFSQGLQDAIERANQAGVLFIAAAGNGGSDGVGDNNDNVANYPSNYPNANVIAVASITSSGTLSSFSNFGANQVDIGAPGSAIYSTLPGKAGKSSYGSYSGTSMATPHVAGAAALYKSINPGATAAQVKDAILNSATPTPSLSGKTTTGGRLNVSTF
ncbi:S8 family serine peptidase [Rudanella paleaurantiibacter]|uniref:S8 family serine peptidase n=1 Tax=Rudanella paleaurantiibacter TaxID=2614655 RepID=A0A7J5U066_9BACT|nr:S8 family peptidase [Rudanella paleaurantiibacter]KAB7731142.1 S8 family serine peptidase [Rudanella paleaurantiibacter]